MYLIFAFCMILALHSRYPLHIVIIIVCISPALNLIRLFHFFAALNYNLYCLMAVVDKYIGAVTAQLTVYC
jgi:hypothetical protein